jgi:UDP-N-acetylbacillosamine transaminase
LGVLSFNGNKIITTSSGGAVLCQKEEDATHIRYLSTQAKSPLPHYEHEEIGYNYRLSNVLAAIGLGQLEQLDARIARRREIFETYRTLLGNIADIKFNEEAEHAFSNRWLSVADFGEIGWQKIYTSLRENLIESRPVWKPLHTQKALAGAPSYLNGNSESLFKRCLCLPSGSALTEEQLHRIVNIIESSL